MSEARLIAKAQRLAVEQDAEARRLLAEIRQMRCRPLTPLRRRLKARAALAVATSATLLALVAKLSAT